MAYRRWLLNDSIRQYLTAGELDQMHLAFSPVLLGNGEHLLAGINLLKLGFKVAEIATGEGATHVVLTQV